ncbi:MAG: hypothetical protein KC912_20095 [Proteobacteria bacterium]|nr:hypothetical protein [Pseudomonadota bacterium]
MARESITLETRDKRTVEGTAEVSRSDPGTRLAKFFGFAIGGFVAGMATIPVPGLHFVAPWALPILGLAVGGYLYSRTAVIQAVQGTCPDCDTTFDAPGGPLGADDVWVRCSSCSIPLKVVMPEAN